MCPEEYVGYKDSCYRYYIWVFRHYLREEYAFQETWSKASAQCEAEGGALLSANSAEELYFIKVYGQPPPQINNSYQALFILPST
jgi:hypothetical protein